MPVTPIEIDPIEELRRTAQIEADLIRQKQNTPEGTTVPEPKIPSSQEKSDNMPETSGKTELNEQSESKE